MNHTPVTEKILIAIDCAMSRDGINTNDLTDIIGCDRRTSSRILAKIYSMRSELLNMKIEHDYVSNDIKDCMHWVRISPNGIQ